MMPIVFSADWFALHQARLLGVLNNPVVGRWAREVLTIPHGAPVLWLAPHAVTLRAGGRQFVSLFHPHKVYAYRLRTRMEHLWQALHWWDMRFANPLCPAWNVGFDSLTAYPDPNPESTTIDGYLTYDVSAEGAGDWASARTAESAISLGDSSVSSECAGFSHSNLYDTWWGMTRSAFGFDISAIAAVNTVDAATLSLYGLAQSDKSVGHAFNVFSSTLANNTALAAGDYLGFGTTAFSSEIAHAGFNDAAYNDFTLNATGRTYLETAIDSLSGIAILGTRMSDDASNTEPTSGNGKIFGGTDSFSCIFADTAGTSSDPKLAVTHSAPAGADPITALGVSAVQVI